MILYYILSLLVGAFGGVLLSALLTAEKIHEVYEQGYLDGIEAAKETIRRTTWVTKKD